MPKPDDNASIEIAEDMGFQAASWRVQRIGWILMLLIIAAALSGLFGGGVLSSVQAGDASGGLLLDYERFVRRSAPQSLRLTLGPASRQSDSTVAAWIDRDWLERQHITSISPEPMSSVLDAGTITYTFLSRNLAEPLVVRVHLEALKFGKTTSRAGIPAGPSVSFMQIAYP